MTSNPQTDLTQRAGAASGGLRASLRSHIVDRTGGIDWLLVSFVVILVGIGLATIYSASNYDAIINQNGDDMYYLRKQLQATVFGVILLFFAARIQYDFFMRRPIMLFIMLAALVCILLLLSPLKVTVNYATRWVKIPLFGTFQPAEVVKIATIVYCSCAAVKLGKRINTWLGLFEYMLIPLGYAGLIYVISKNLSSAIIVAGIAAVIAFVASSNYSKYILLMAVTLACATAVILYTVKKDKGFYPVLYGIDFNELLGGNSSATTEDEPEEGDGGQAIAVRQDSEQDAAGQDSELGFRGNRIVAWLYPEDDPQGTSFQTIQSLYAIGSGGLTGKGYGNSIQKLGFLPEAQNDMVFAIFCEEWGLIGAIFLIFLFILLVYRCNVISVKSPDLFGTLLVAGVGGQIAIQMLLNIAVVTNTIPNTGISLPFISYGGTSSALLLAEIGVVLNVSKGGRISEKVKNAARKNPA